MVSQGERRPLVGPSLGLPVGRQDGVEVSVAGLEWARVAPRSTHAVAASGRYASTQSAGALRAPALVQRSSRAQV